MARVRTAWPVSINVIPINTIATEMVDPELNRYPPGTSQCESRHSTTAEPCAMLYAAPFDPSRKADESALRVLYCAVTQNSRKWKTHSDETKNGTRHSAIDCRARRTVIREETPRTRPRRNARVDMPDSDVFPPGRRDGSNERVVEVVEVSSLSS